MLKEIIDAGGSAYLIPAALFALMLYGIKGLFGLHGRKGQHRKEFLELWNSERSRDDLWLEVAVRHLFGTYIPARVIRLAMEQPDKSKALLDLSEMWPLLRFDPASQTVDWSRKQHTSPRYLKVSRYVLFVGYFALMLIAVYAMMFAIQLGPALVMAWLLGLCAVSIALVAFTCLQRLDAIKIAITIGDVWLARINGAAVGQTKLAERVPAHLDHSTHAPKRPTEEPAA